MSSLDDYERGQSVGSGGFADVYSALHIPSRNRFALKIGRADAESRARIRREIAVQRRLSHANILKIIDWDRTELSWFVTELAEGNLGEVHGRGPLSESEVVRLLEEILSALGCAHRRNLVHRDVSLGNILRTRGQWVLADWGYVMAPDASVPGRITRTGTAGGTFTWASPEMLKDAHRVDRRTDLYSLGKIAAWLLTGKLPEIGGQPELPADDRWSAFLGRMTEVDPDERFQSAEDALAALSGVVSAVPNEENTPTAEAGLVQDDPVVDYTSAIKRYLVSAEHRIRLAELITRTTKEAIEGSKSPRFSTNRLDQGDALLERVHAYVESCRPIMHNIFLGAMFGESGHDALWTKSVQRLVDSSANSGGYR